MTHTFEREPKSGLILVHIWVDEKYKFKMMLDTGASFTTFDLNSLYFADYPIGNIVGTGMVETASGKMEVDTAYFVHSIIENTVISAFGHTVRGMKVQVYDFLTSYFVQSTSKHGIISDYDGLLGLDFFENTEFRINTCACTHSTSMKNQTIEVFR